MKSVKKIVKVNRTTSKVPKIIIDPKLNEFKDIKLKSGKLDEINKLNFNLSF